MVNAGFAKLPLGDVYEPQWQKIKIGSGNGLVPSGIKPLSEPMLILIHVYVAIWRHKVKWINSYVGFKG